MLAQPAEGATVTAPSRPALRRHLIETGLAGDVATSPGNTYDNCARLAAGHDDYTFGLSHWRDVDSDGAADAVRGLCGDAAIDRPAEGPGWIDPDAALDAVDVHRDRLRDAVRRGATVLLATGHPSGLLAHYAALGRALRASGCRVATPRDDTWVQPGRGIRFVDAVAMCWTGGDLAHTHRSDLMEAMLAATGEDGGPVDLVVGDHGMAGAAIEAGIPTLSIADVNDPALPLAQAHGDTDAVLPIDDNLAPRLFEPVTAAILDGLPEA